MPVSVLLFEFLHADSVAYAESATSLREEGRAMLLAVLHDLRRLPRVAVTVVLADELRDETWTTGLVASGVTCRWMRSPLLHSLGTLSADFDMVLPIAPEIDGILVNVVKSLSEESTILLTPQPKTVEQFSDKLMTFRALCNKGIPTVQTHLATDCEALQERQLVLKPRYGAGCDGVFRCGRDDLLKWMTQVRNPDNFIVQPWLHGVALSIAVIGCGPDRPALVLPLAEQFLSWRQSRPTYTGGLIPARIEASVQIDAAKLARKLSSVLAITRGYVGMDLLRLNDGSLTVVEVNPRLCTSYIGYQAAISDNLAEWLLLQRADCLPGSVRAVRFSSSGDVTT